MQPKDGRTVQLVGRLCTSAFKSTPTQMKTGNTEVRYSHVHVQLPVPQGLEATSCRKAGISNIRLMDVGT